MNSELYAKLWLLKQNLLKCDIFNHDVHILISDVFFGLYCDYVINLDDIVLANHVRDSIYRHIDAFCDSYLMLFSFGKKTKELNARRKKIYVNDSGMDTITNELKSFQDIHNFVNIFDQGTTKVSYYHDESKQIWRRNFKRYRFYIDPYGSTLFNYFQLKISSFHPKRILLIGNLMNISFSKKTFCISQSHITTKSMENIYNKHAHTYLTLYDLEISIYAAADRVRLKNNKNIEMNKIVTIYIGDDWCIVQSESQYKSIKK